jgi:hypothetical protein
MIWDVWKQGFAAWEQATTQYMEKVLQNPGVLGPAGAMLTAAMKTKAATDRALAAWWSGFGLPTRRDQERALHKLNQLESRLYDLEEHLLERGGPGDMHAGADSPASGHQGPAGGHQGPAGGRQGPAGGRQGPASGERR